VSKLLCQWVDHVIQWMSECGGEKVNQAWRQSVILNTYWLMEMTVTRGTLRP